MNALISRTVWILAILSLLTDISSEMLYPVMPFYLQSIGFSTSLIGLPAAELMHISWPFEPAQGRR